MKYTVLPTGNIVDSKAAEQWEMPLLAKVLVTTVKVALSPVTVPLKITAAVVRACSKPDAGIDYRLDD